MVATKFCADFGQGAPKEALLLWVAGAASLAGARDLSHARSQRAIPFGPQASVCARGPLCGDYGKMKFMFQFGVARFRNCGDVPR